MQIRKYKFFDEEINEYALLLRKGDYQYEYTNNWKRFDETFLPDKETFYSSLNMESVTDVYYVHAKKYGKYSIIKM